MLRTNSKKASENVKAYIIEHAHPESYDDRIDPADWASVARFVTETFRTEKYCAKEDYRFYRGNEFPAVDDLAEILEGSDAEKIKYTEERAEALLTALIYRELKKGAARV